MIGVSKICHSKNFFSFLSLIKLDCPQKSSHLGVFTKKSLLYIAFGVKHIISLQCINDSILKLEQITVLYIESKISYADYLLPVSGTGVGEQRRVEKKPPQNEICTIPDGMKSKQGNILSEIYTFSFETYAKDSLLKKYWKTSNQEEMLLHLILLSSLSPKTFGNLY